MRVIEEERDYYKKEYETLKAVKRSSSARATPTKVGLWVLCKSYHISSVIRQSFFPSKTIPKIQICHIGQIRSWDCLGRVKVIAKFPRTI